MTIAEKVFLDRKISIYANKLSVILAALYNPSVTPYIKDENEYIKFEVEEYEKIMNTHSDINKKLSFISGIYDNFSRHYAQVPKFEIDNINSFTEYEKEHIVNFWIEEMYNNCRINYRMSKIMDYLNF